MKHPRQLSIVVGLAALASTCLCVPAAQASGTSHALSASATTATYPWPYTNGKCPAGTPRAGQTPLPYTPWPCGV